MFLIKDPIVINQTLSAHVQKASAYLFANPEFPDVNKNNMADDELYVLPQILFFLGPYFK